MASGTLQTGGSDLEGRVRAADDLVRQTVVSLCRGRFEGSPEGARGATAREALAGLSPGVRGALGALEGIEGARPLTDEENARRRAFRTLLQGIG